MSLTEGLLSPLLLVAVFGAGVLAGELVTLALLFIGHVVGEMLTSWYLRR